MIPLNPVWNALFFNFYMKQTVESPTSLKVLFSVTHGAGGRVLGLIFAGYMGMCRWALRAPTPL